MNKLRGALRSMTMWVNGILLALIPFTEEIVIGVQENLPVLNDYLPDNIYKTMGITVVVFNILRRFKTKDSLAEKGAQ